MLWERAGVIPSSPHGLGRGLGALIGAPRAWHGSLRVLLSGSLHLSALVKLGLAPFWLYFLTLSSGYSVPPIKSLSLCFALAHMLACLECANV